jgi:hypothetical protein
MTQRPDSDRKKGRIRRGAWKASAWKASATGLTVATLSAGLGSTEPPHRVSPVEHAEERMVSHTLDHLHEPAQPEPLRVEAGSRTEGTATMRGSDPGGPRVTFSPGWPESS